jgi:hypothetical protein
MKTSTICRILGFLLLLASPATGAESQSQLISDFRLKHGEPRVVRDAMLDRIAQEQARAMAAKDQLSHDVLGPFIRRIAPARAGRAAENIAYGFDSFEKTLGQWIDSPDHRRNLLLRNASRVGIASARDASGKRTYWAMVIADSDEPKPTRKKHSNSPEGPQRGGTPSARSRDSDCRIKLLNLCI